MQTLELTLCLQNKGTDGGSGDGVKRNIVNFVMNAILLETFSCIFMLLIGLLTESNLINILKFMQTGLLKS